MAKHSVGTTSHDFYQAMQQGFGWHVPEHFNMAEMCSRRWAMQADAGQRLAIIEHASSEAGDQAQPPVAHTYAQLQQAADALSHVLTDLGVQRGDRVAIVLPQRFETAVAYMAVMQMGAVAMPLSLLFGPEALEYRLQDSEAVAAIVDASSVNNVLTVRPGVVVGYERNTYTNEKYDKAGITVLPIPGEELGRGRGGARCMSCPMERDGI